MTAEVIAVGSGRVLKDGNKLPLEVKVGDIELSNVEGVVLEGAQPQTVLLGSKTVLAVIGFILGGVGGVSSKMEMLPLFGLVMSVG